MEPNETSSHLLTLARISSTSSLQHFPVLLNSLRCLIDSGQLRNSQFPQSVIRPRTNLLQGETCGPFVETCLMLRHKIVTVSKSGEPDVVRKLPPHALLPRRVAHGSEVLCADQKCYLNPDVPLARRRWQIRGNTQGKRASCWNKQSGYDPGYTPLFFSCATTIKSTREVKIRLLIPI